MASEWFYTQDGKGKTGPVSSAQLQALAKSRKLKPTDKVWKEGMARWVAASAIKGLFPSTGETATAKKPQVASSTAPNTGKSQPKARPTPENVKKPKRSDDEAEPSEEVGGRGKAIGFAALVAVACLGGAIVVAALYLNRGTTEKVLAESKDQPNEAQAGASKKNESPTEQPKEKGTAKQETPMDEGTDKKEQPPEQPKDKETKKKDSPPEQTPTPQIAQTKDVDWTALLSEDSEWVKTINLWNLLAVSEDGEHFAGTDGPQKVYYHNRNGLDRFELTSGDRDKGSGFQAFALSPDGTRLAVGDYKRYKDEYDSGVFVYDMTTKQQVCQIKMDKWSTLVFGPDSKRLADCGGNIWDAQTGKLVLTIESKSIRSLAFSTDGKRIVAGAGESGGDVQVWDAVNGKKLLSFKGHTKEIRSIAFSPDGKQIATYSPSDGWLKVWMDDGQEVFRVRSTMYEPSPVLLTALRQVAFSADGKWVAGLANDDKTSGFKLWDSRTGKEAKFKFTRYYVTILAFTSDGDGLISAGYERFDKTKYLINMWDVPKSQKSFPKDFTNSLGMTFVWIPPGKFMMGSPNFEENRRRHEIQHQVKLRRGFYMGQYTVTQGQWQAIMGSNPSFFKGDKLPVTSVSWDDCQEFIRKLREKDNKLYRLPTEAEWEYSCRAGTTTAFHTGEKIDIDQANFFVDGGDSRLKGKKNLTGKLMPVGSFPANAFGLFDMHGNVMQWCQDWSGDYPEYMVVDPQGPKTGQSRVLRGSMYFAPDSFGRSAARAADPPNSRSLPFGFRICFFPD